MKTEKYFKYLVQMLGRPEYSDMLRMLFDMYFSIDISKVNDQSRLGDGIYVRMIYLSSIGEEPDRKAFDMPCRVLEVLVGLAIRMDERAGEPGVNMTTRFFWDLIDNLGLSIMTNQHLNKTKVSTIINTWITRSFAPNGYGSPFPLKNPITDQRCTPLWDQLNAYIMENY